VSTYAQQIRFDAIRRRKAAAVVHRLANSELVAGVGERDTILQLQRTAGNQAVVAALAVAAAGPAKGVLQRIGWDDVIDAAQWANPITFSQKAIRTVTGVEVNPFVLAEQAVRASASRISIPMDYFMSAGFYAAFNSDDGAVILDAINQTPKHYEGGWLLKVQDGAEAITFGNSVFYDRSVPTEATFIHELVHIHQYHKLGRVAFLTSYFGLSLATIIKRAIAGEPIEAMMSSPHERDAYALEKRFKSWRAANPKP
jgi:hypothetical protein